VLPEAQSSLHWPIEQHVENTRGSAAPKSRQRFSAILDDNQSHDAFDLFLAWPIDDPYLESIRKRCHDTVRTSQPGRPGEDIGEDAKDRIRALLRELQAES
jgi:hypothetical protein